MNKTTSVYLDLVRFLAAFTIFVAHANYDRFTGGMPYSQYYFNLGNDAVMVFFVLSGFVIAYVANGKENSIDTYFISRFARLYSVVLPALILTVTLDYFGSQIEFELYNGDWYETSYPVARFLANFFFVNELWFLSIRPFSNGPFWSIGYEFWYYVLFALAFFLKKPIKYILITMVCVLIGPSILLLMPIWLMGVIVFKITSTRDIPESFGWLLLMLSIFGYLFYRVNGGQEYILEHTINIVGTEFYENLHWSKFFTSSYIIGTFVSMNFVGFVAVSHRFEKFFSLLSKPIRYMASYTFALYLLHYPLLQFFSALTFSKETNETVPFIVLSGTLISVWLLGAITEKQKHNYKRIFTNLWQKCRNRKNTTSTLEQ